MRDKISALIRPPRFHDEEQARVAHIQNIFLQLSLAVALAGSLIYFVLGRLLASGAMAIGGVVVGIALLLLRAGQLYLSVNLLLATFVVFTGVMQLLGMGVHDTITSLYAAVLVIGSLLLKGRAFILLVAFTLLVIAIVVAAEMASLTRSTFASNWSLWLDLAFILGITATAARLLTDNLHRSLAHARANEQALAQQAEELRISEERYRILAANIPDSAFLVYDHDLRFVLVDGPEVEATGYSRAALEGRTVYETLPPAFVSRVEPNMRAVLAGRSFTDEIPFNDQLHAYYYIPLLDSAGCVIYGMILARNVTEQRRTEAALLAGQAQLRMLTDSMVDTIVQTDADFKVVYISPSARRVLGLDPASYVGQHVGALVHSDDLPKVTSAMMEAIAIGEPSVRIEHRIRAAADASAWVESEIRLLYDDQARFCGAILGSRDVTTRKQIETERERLIAELAAKNAELERFTYTVSHDLKSPLITIQGFLGYLERDARAGDLNRLHSDVNRISVAVRKMERLLNELLELSRVGRIVNPPQLVPFDAVVREALELAAGRIAECGAHVSIAPELPMIYGDRTRLVEVMQNLVDNAIKFRNPEAMPRIEIGAKWDESGAPVFFVRDNGIGIEPEYQEQIFGLFNKLDPRSDGTGVGLAIAQRIIETHGGRIWVESSGRGAGATFYFTLPGKPDPARERGVP